MARAGQPVFSPPLPIPLQRVYAQIRSLFRFPYDPLSLQVEFQPLFSESMKCAGSIEQIPFANQYTDHQSDRLEAVRLRQYGDAGRDEHQWFTCCITCLAE